MTPWINIPEADLARSPALRLAHERHTELRKVPAVNLLALARRDQAFMSTWLPDPGYTFVSCDFTSLEPCITAHFSGDKFYKYATYDGVGKRPWFHENGTLMIDDIYLMTASSMPGVSDTIVAFFRNGGNCDQWVIDSEPIKGNKLIKPIRSKAKTACLGFGYGMAARKFVKQSYEAGMNVTLEEARGMYKAYWNLFQGVQTLSKKLEALVKKNGSLINPMGYRLTPEPHKAFNAFVQSTASGVLDLLCSTFFTSAPKAKFVAMIHDEVVFQVPKDSIEECRQVMNKSVIELNQTLGWSVDMRLGWCEANSFAGFK